MFCCFWDERTLIAKTDYWIIRCESPSHIFGFDHLWLFTWAQLLSQSILWQCCGVYIRPDGTWITSCVYVYVDAMWDLSLEATKWLLEWCQVFGQTGIIEQPSFITSLVMLLFVLLSDCPADLCLLAKKNQSLLHWYENILVLIKYQKRIIQRIRNTAEWHSLHAFFGKMVDWHMLLALYWLSVQWRHWHIGVCTFAVFCMVNRL